jgi:hypothetical protein
LAAFATLVTLLRDATMRARSFRKEWPPFENGIRESTMKYAIAIAALMLWATSASAQFFGSDGGAGRYHGYVPQPGYRAINHDRATGRTYARDADYIPVRKARPKVRR